MEETNISQEQNPLGTAPVGGLIGKFAIPAIISMLVSALYNIVDQIFIANASYLGSFGNAKAAKIRMAASPQKTNAPRMTTFKARQDNRRRIDCA